MRFRSVLLLLVLLNPIAVFSQEKPIEFFAFLNMMEGDTVERSLEYNITYIQSVGYRGVGIDLTKDSKETNRIISDYDFKSSIAYFEVDIDKAEIPIALKDKIKALKGSKTILTPSFHSKSNKFPVPSKQADQELKELLLQIYKLAHKSKLQVAILPQYKSYVESHKHAFELVEQIGKPSVGFCFSLSDWLAVENLEQRNYLNSALMTYRNKLKVLIINGANRVITEKENPWEDYLLPLGEGTFDTYNLVAYLIQKQLFKGPIGVQCKGLKGDKMQLAEDIMLVWKSYLTYLGASAK